MRLLATLFFAIFAAPAISAVPTVVTDVPAVQSLSAQVMGDLGTPALLLGKGADPHNFQLRPSQARALSRADLLFWVGPDLTPWLARAINGIGLRGKAVALLHSAGTRTRQFAALGGDHGDDHSGLDPHAWLDPANARAWVTVIATELSRADPDHAAIYGANAANARRAIDTTETRVRAILAPVRSAPIVVFHNAYGYFADAFGIDISGSISEGDAAAPGAARLAAIRDDLRNARAVCIFPEAQHDPAYVQTVVAGTGVRVGAPLDPSGTTLDPGPALYGTLLTTLADAIAACVSAAAG